MTKTHTLASFSALAILALGGCSGPQPDPTSETPSAEQSPAPELELRLPPFAEAAAAAIDAEGLRAHVAALSDDRLEGRAPGSEGDRMAREYLIQTMRDAGLEPGGPDGGWEQPFAIVGVEARVPATWAFRGPEGTTELAWSEEFIAFSGVQEERAVVEDAELVFVGYGIEAPEYEWDDYEGADLTGKVLVMLNNDPDWDPDLFEGERRLYYGRWTYKYEIAAAKGAAGAIVIHTTPSAGYPWQVVQTSWTGTQFELPAGDEPRIQVGGWVTYEAAEELFTAAGQDLEALTAAARERDFRPVPLGLTTSLDLAVTVDRSAETANVLGMLPGSDPELAREVVIYTAHHDHLGRGTAEGDEDVIYNGALDNGAGMAQILAIGETLAAQEERPRRSLLFAFVAAEEQGLLGSKHFAAHPTVPPGRIAANINYDGGNIWGPTSDIAFIGYGKSSLDTVVEAAARRQGRTVVGDQYPDRGYYYRSDQFSLAKIGVPAIYLDNGVEFVGDESGEIKAEMEAWTEVHYHQPSDELADDWDFSGMVEDARLGLFCGLHIAQTQDLPAWRPGDEFEAARAEALVALADGGS